MSQGETRAYLRSELAKALPNATNLQVTELLDFAAERGLVAREDHPRCERCDQLLAVRHGDAISDEEGFPICEDCGGENATPLLEDHG